MTAKTHYNMDEFGQLLVVKFPRLSAMTLIKLKESLGIRVVNAGAQRLYRKADADRILEWLTKAKADGQLVERNGFWVAPEFHD